MGLITGLLTLPLAPVRGTVWIAEQIQEQAEGELYDEGAIQAQLHRDRASARRRARSTTTELADGRGRAARAAAGARGRG